MKALAVLPLLLALPACTAKNSGYEKQLARLEENVAILKSERDRLEERIAVLESERDVEGATSATPALERPPLTVVALAPPEAPVAESPGGPEVPPFATGAPPPSASTELGRPLLHGSGTELHQSPSVEAQ